ncbi:MAG TPA: hypothetical protein VFR67_24830, partial [Pilimelia sp.]|nr:hypothetical protein [Pilimelia sp.]
MSAELDRRIAEAVRSIADEPVVAPPPPAAVRARAADLGRLSGRRVGTPAPGWRGPLLAAAAVLVMLAGLAWLPGTLAGSRAPGPGAAPADVTLPVEFAGLSLLTASVSASPPGRAIALYRPGTLGIRYLGTSQVVVVGADGRTYRRLDLAERRGAVGADGEWHAADAMLSPDGLAAAVAVPDEATDRIDVVDLRTGAARAYRLDPPAGGRLLDWSPDGRYLAIETYEKPQANAPGVGILILLDTRTGEITRLTGASLTGSWMAVSFSPDGTTVAIGGFAGPGDNAVVVVDLTGDVRRTLPLKPHQSLAGREAWSPDGRLLVIEDRSTDPFQLSFLDATGTGRPVPDPIPYVNPDGKTFIVDLLGWRSPGSLLVGVEHKDYEILESPTDGGAPRTLSRLTRGSGQLFRA